MKYFYLVALLTGFILISIETRVLQKTNSYFSNRFTFLNFSRSEVYMIIPTDTKFHLNDI